MKTRCLLLLLLAGCQGQAPPDAPPAPPRFGIVWIAAPAPACNCESNPCADARCQAHGGCGNCECKKPKTGVPPELAPQPRLAAYAPELGWAVRYTPTQWTQQIAVTDGRDRITPVPIARLEGKWQVSGGMLGIRGWTSEKYKLVPAGGYHWVDNIAVRNGLGSFQFNRGIVRSYPDGTVFHDVLRNEMTDVVFEHRVRSKRAGFWHSEVVHRDVDARPAGYTGLRVTCASCHVEAGSGSYASGLVPGGDTIIGDRLEWGVAGFR